MNGYGCHGKKSQSAHCNTERCAKSSSSSSTSLYLPPSPLPQSDTPFIPLSLLMCYLCHSLLFYLNLNKTKIMLTFSLACSSWQSWSRCSRTCGLGINNKKRTCGGKRKCEGPASITSSCNLQPCQSRDDCYDFYVI